MGVTDRSVFRRVIISAALSAVVAASVFWARALCAERGTQREHGVRVDVAGRRSVPAAAERAITGRVSTRNPLHLLAGSNDYRTVDMPGVRRHEETGDAWLGLFKSFDGGARGRARSCRVIRRTPHHPAWPRRCKGYQAGADPVVRPAPTASSIYAGLAFDRDPRELTARAPSSSRASSTTTTSRPAIPIAYLGTSLVASSRPATTVPRQAVDGRRHSASRCADVSGGDARPRRLPHPAVARGHHLPGLHAQDDRVHRRPVRHHAVTVHRLRCDVLRADPRLAGRGSREPGRHHRDLARRRGAVRSVETFRRDGRRRRHPRGPFHRSRPQLPAAWHRSQVPPRPQERRLRSLEVHAAAAEQGRRPAGGGRGLPVRSGHLRRLLDGL